MVNKKYKDTLFRTIFSNKKDLLSLYNALNGTHYTDEELITLTTLEGAIYLGYQNDLSFLIHDTMLLYEHQSTKNPNMPLRGVIYFSALYQTYVSEHKHDMYGSKRIPLPIPQFIVFYNGMAKAPDRWTERLSDSFLYREKHPGWALECTAEYININLGHNKELLDACRILWEYAYFINAVRENQKNHYEFEEAVINAMDMCIEQGILKEILERNRDIMIDLLREYDLNFHIESEKKLSYEEGINNTIRKYLFETLSDYGEIPDSLRREIEEENNPDTLDDWFRKARTVHSIKEFEETIR